MGVPFGRELGVTYFRTGVRPQGMGGITHWSGQGSDEALPSKWVRGDADFGRGKNIELLTGVTHFRRRLGKK